MEDDLKTKMQTKTIKIKSNNIFENRRQPQFFEKGRRPKKNNATKQKLKLRNNNILEKNNATKNN